MNYIITLDVGGTEIKACALGEKGEALCETACFPSLAKENKEKILENFSRIFSYIADSVNGTLSGTALAFPGDFDYPGGVCLIKGIDKYEGIYGVNLREEFTKILERDIWQNKRIKEVPIIFINDVEAFALGEDGGKGKLLALAIGTGAGSAFLVDGSPAKNGTPGVPENGWIYPVPFKGSIIDDHLSKRGLKALSEKILGKPLEGKELAELCEKGDKNATAVYKKFGETIAEAVAPFVKEFKPDIFVLGGQVTKSFPLFGEPLKALCEENGALLRITENTSVSAFKGLYKAFSASVKTK